MGVSAVRNTGDGGGLIDRAVGRVLRVQQGSAGGLDLEAVDRVTEEVDGVEEAKLARIAEDGYRVFAGGVGADLGEDAGARAVGVHGAVKRVGRVDVAGAGERDRSRRGAGGGRRDF